MRVEYDKEAKAIYIYTENTNKIFNTEELIKYSVMLDKDAFNNIVGIGILNVQKIEEI